jgi:hypothetical protein
VDDVELEVTVVAVVTDSVLVDSAVEDVDVLDEFEVE